MCRQGRTEYVKESCRLFTGHVFFFFLMGRVGIGPFRVEPGQEVLKLSRAGSGHPYRTRIDPRASTQPGTQRISTDACSPFEVPEFWISNFRR